MRRIFVLALVSACWLWSADPEAEHLPPGPGKAVVGTVCSECHSVNNIRRQRLSRDEWSSEVSDMVDRGAKANDEQVAAILDYLTLNFGKDAKVRVNTAPMVEFKAVLELTADEAGAIVAYRDANGAFHQLSDLLKVPGVDGKKIETKKDRLEF
jgi:competence ComEA-like helix-hairpin-helix protein